MIYLGAGRWRDWGGEGEAAGGGRQGSNIPGQRATERRPIR